MQTLGQCLIRRSPRIKAIDPKIDIGQCLDCGFVFANPRPTSEEIADYYSKLDKTIPGYPTRQQGKHFGKDG